MKIAVTGATGFIGKHLVAALLDRGDSVLALTRSPEKATQVLGPTVQVARWNPPAADVSWTDPLRDCEVVINLAGEPVADKRWTEQQKDRILRSRVDATNAIVDAMEESSDHPGILINGSAVGYYGSRGEDPLTEESAPGTDFLAHVCTEWEAAARRAEKYGVRVVVLRTAGLVLGKGGGALPRLVLPFKLYGGGILGPPRQMISWIHIQDEVGIILLAADNGNVAGPINVTAPHPVTMETFSRSLGAALHRPVWVPGVPTVMRLALGERSEVVFASAAVIPKKVEELEYGYRFPDLDEALTDLFGRSS